MGDNQGNAEKSSLEKKSMEKLINGGSSLTGAIG